MKKFYVTQEELVKYVSTKMIAPIEAFEERCDELEDKLYRFTETDDFDDLESTVSELTDRVYEIEQKIEGITEALDMQNKIESILAKNMIDSAHKIVDVEGAVSALELDKTMSKIREEEQ